jgi:hypothetical protein
MGLHGEGCSMCLSTRGQDCSFYIPTCIINLEKEKTMWRMVSSGMLCRVALVRTDVSEELRASIIRVRRIGKLGTTLAVTSNRRTLRRNTKLLVIASVVPSSPILVTLMKEALSSSETSVLTRATRRNIREDTILHSYRREYLKVYEKRCVSVTGRFTSLLIQTTRCKSALQLENFQERPSNIKIRIVAYLLKQRIFPVTTSDHC